MKTWPHNADLGDGGAKIWTNEQTVSTSKAEGPFDAELNPACGVMPLKLRQVEVFNALMEAGSVSRAADLLGLSQPAVSIALSNLESTLGFQLFRRSKGFFRPTAEAEALKSDMAQGLQALARIDTHAHALRTGSLGQVSVAADGLMSMFHLPRAIALFQAQNPGIRVDLRTATSIEAARLVSHRLADIGFIDAPVPVADLTTDSFALECVCILRRDDPLADAPAITPDLLHDRPMIALTGSHSIDRQVAEAFAQADVPLRPAASAGHPAIARTMVAHGPAVSIVDPINGTADLNDGVVWRPFHPHVRHQMVMITSSLQPLGIAAADLADSLRHSLAVYGENSDTDAPQP